MTPIGLGLDLIDLAHFRLHYGEDDPELLARCFTATELAEAGEAVDRLPRLAARFAVKEAVVKALGGVRGVAHTDIETILGESGAPQVRLHGAAQALADEQGVGGFLVSLTHSITAASAVVIALSGGPR